MLQVCTGEKSAILWGRKSFPSLECVFIAFSASAACLNLHRVTFLHSTQRLLSLLQWMILLSALKCCVTEFAFYRASAYDVIFGIIIGAIFGIISDSDRISHIFN